MHKQIFLSILPFFQYLYVVWYFKTCNVILPWQKPYFNAIASQESSIYVTNFSSMYFQLLVYMYLLKEKMSYLR
jgi:hypothetical protein